MPGAPCALPRLVHFTRPPARHGAGGGLPALVWRVALQSWARFFPRSGGFVHTVWTDGNLTDCVAQEFPEHLAGFLALPGGIERADLGRYCLLHRHGGVYTDLDYEAREPFFEDLAAAAAAGAASLVESPYEELGERVQNSLMASCPGHPLWRMALAAVFAAGGRHRWSDAEGGTGPRMLSRLLAAREGGAVAVLPCGLYQRAVEPGGGAARCGHVADGARQRGIHWGAMSHASFMGLALRAGVFREVHPELKGRRLLHPSLEREALAAAEAAAASSAAMAVIGRCAGPGGCPGAELAAAEALLREALAAAPGDARAHFLLGSALGLQGRLPEALLSYRAALALEPSMEAARLAAEQVEAFVA